MKKQIYGLLAGAAILSGSQASAAGFALIEQSVSAMGTAYAGAASIAEDASTIWFNPAGLMNLCGCQVVAGAHIIVPVIDFDDQGSEALTFTPVAPGVFAPTIVPMNGNDGRDAGEAGIVGNNYFSCRFDDCWAFGLGINAPFGLVTDYDNDWKGRYQAVRSSILTVNLNPTIAYRINDCLSIGAGFDVMYLHAKLSNKIDFGLLGGFLAPSVGAPLGTPIFGPPQGADGFVHLRGNSWGYGGNLGILWELTPCTRIGLAWRSEVKHTIKGKERFDDVPTPLELSPVSAFIDTRFKAKVTLPQSVIFSAYHQLNNCWAVVGDVMWTKWNVLDRLRITFNNPNQADSVLPLKWDNAWRVAVGAIWTPDCYWTLRAGFAWDQTPTPNKHLRIARLPDQDRYWLAVGVGYTWNECLHFDIGYAHLFIPEAKIDQLEEFEEAAAVGSPSFNLTRALQGGIKGKYNAYTDIFSAQVVWSF